jgi:hypothetical protein
MFVFILCLYRERPCDGLIPHPRSPTDCLRIKKLKWNITFHGCSMFQSGGNKKEREREYETQHNKNLWRIKGKTTPGTENCKYVCRVTF